MKIPGRRHGGAQSKRQRTAAEDLGLAADQVGGDAGERNRQIVEALDLGVRQRDLVENQRNLLAGVEALGKLHALAQSEFEVVGIIAGVLFAAEGQVVERRLPRHHLVPVDAIHHLAHFSGIASGGINSAHQSAHAGAGNVVHRNVVFLQPGNDAHMRQPESSTALQHQARS